MISHVYQKDGKTIWEMHKSNLTCLVIFVAKGPEAAWNGGEIYLDFHVSHFSNKIPTEHFL